MRLMIGFLSGRCCAQVISKETGFPGAAVGVAVGAGSRIGAVGDALLLKHLTFQGTTARSDIKLARDLEAIGVSVTSQVRAPSTRWRYRSVRNWFV